MTTSWIVGIDFGTTVSSVAVIQDQKPLIIPNQRGAKFTPSVVAFDAQGRSIVGESALANAAANPSRTVFSVKQHLGTRWAIDTGQQTLGAIEISAIIVKQLKEDAERFLGAGVSDAVMTVPADFHQGQRTALCQAAKNAGWNVIRLIAAPTAAALSAAMVSQETRNVAVLDLGGGTLGLSLSTISSESGSEETLQEILAVSGDPHVGGDDFDARLVDHFIRTFSQTEGIDLSNDLAARRRLKEAAEKAKIELSTQERVDVYVPYLAADANGYRHLSIEITRSEFDSLTHDLVQAITECCTQTLAEAKVASWDGDNFQIDELVVVGMSTKMPSVRKAAEQVFGIKAKTNIDPEAAACGAAILGAILGGYNLAHTYLLVDVTPLAIGIEVDGHRYLPIIKRQTTIPTKQIVELTTTADDQSEAVVRLTQGKAGSLEDQTVGYLVLTDILPATCGQPSLSLVIDIDAAGAITGALSQDESGEPLSSQPLRPESPIDTTLLQTAGYAVSLKTPQD